MGQNKDLVCRSRSICQQEFIQAVEIQIEWGCHDCHSNRTINQLRNGRINWVDGRSRRCGFDFTHFWKLHHLYYFGWVLATTLGAHQGHVVLNSWDACSGSVASSCLLVFRSLCIDSLARHLRWQRFLRQVLGNIEIGATEQQLRAVWHRRQELLGKFWIFLYNFDSHSRNYQCVDFFNADHQVGSTLQVLQKAWHFNLFEVPAPKDFWWVI